MTQEAGPDWRPDLNPSPSVPSAPVDPAAAGFALPMGVAPVAPPPPPPPPGMRPRSRFAARGGLAALGIAIVIVAVKVLLFSGLFRAISVATDPTYHEPTTIAGDSKSSDASIKSTVSQMLSGIELPALQGGHTEGAGYTDAQGALQYIFILAQDNGGNDSPRQGVNLDSLFGGIDGTELSAPVTSSFNGITLECATLTVLSGTSNVPLNACDWYNADAFGVFVQYNASSLSATQQLETSLLNAMTG